MKKALFFILIFSITLYGGEHFLKKGNKAGFQTHYNGFEIVDSLISYQDYYTDDYGNYVLSPLITETLKGIYNYTDCNISDSLIENKIASTDGVKRILNEFCALKYIKTPNTEFEKFALNILQKKSLDNVDSLYFNYINYPFNSQGFRSIEFKNVKTDKPKVLIIGDSFVWGMSASPYYNSFTDILSARDYVIYNAGITSVDPIQYLNVAKKHLYTIQPDFVIVNFYTGNDILLKDRIHQKGVPHEHITNAGFFESNPEGVYLNEQDAYNYYASKLEIPKENFFDILLSKTSIGSILWTAINKDRCANFNSKLNDEQQITLTSKYIDSLNVFLEESCISYFFTITPDVGFKKRSNFDYITYDSSKITQIFDNLAYYSPINLNFKDYNEPKDFHFNNSGSIKYANFIDSLLQNKLNGK